MHHTLRLLPLNKRCNVEGMNKWSMRMMHIEINYIFLFVLGAAPVGVQKDETIEIMYIMIISRAPQSGRRGRVAWRNANNSSFNSDHALIMFFWLPFCSLLSRLFPHYELGQPKTPSSRSASPPSPHSLPFLVTFWQTLFIDWLQSLL